MSNSQVMLFASLVIVLLSMWVSAGLEESPRSTKLHSLWQDRESTRDVHLTKSEILQQVAVIRAKRESGSSPVIHGDIELHDANTYARIHYSGDNSPVIIILTYRLSSRNVVSTSNLYRSVNYGVSFEQIDNRLDSSVTGGPVLWYNFHVGNINKNLVVFSHASEAKLFYSTDEGDTWRIMTFSVPTIDPRTLVWNSRHDQWALAHDITNDVLYVTQDLSRSWIRLSDNVDLPSDYQWGNPKYYDDSSVFYNTYDPQDRQRGNYTVGLYYQTTPYNNALEFDPNLGRHDDFLMVGPYIFASKTVNNIVGLYISYKKGSFQKAMIPADDPHQRYYVAHIDELQALVIVEHDSGQNNLYLSDEKGVYFSLSLPDLVVETAGIDLEVINGVNGTLIANQYVRAGPSQPADTKRTLITLDNGGNWELVVPPDRYSNGSTVNCDPPQCSLHLHMDSTAYARLGVYSRDNAPGLIIAHGTIGSQLTDSPDLYLSRDGGVTWEQTLEGSWGVSVADHGGLLVAVRDYHYIPSTELQYSCDEGQSWTSFTYSSVSMTVYGVITEPGEYTTTVSLYGIISSHVWDVVTVNFSTVFERPCGSNDFYNWQPWDERTDTDCILGADVSIERRQPSICCLIGTGYVRDVLVTTCDCTGEDYDCDYGFMHSDGFVGPCIRDPTIQLDDPCQSGQVTSYNKSTGYRKIPGDICKNGLEVVFEPQPFLCCDTPTGQPTDSPMTTKMPTTTQTPTTQPTTKQSTQQTTQAFTTKSPTTKPETQATTPKPDTNTPPITTEPGTSPGSTGPPGPTDRVSGIPSNKYLITVSALGALLALAILVAVVLGVLTAVFASKHSKARRQYLRLATSGDGTGRGGVSFIKDSDTQVLLSSGHGAESDDSDEEPLEP